MKSPDRAIYVKEYAYQKSVSKLDNAIQELLERFLDNETAQSALRSAHAEGLMSDPPCLLSPNKLQEIKEKQPHVFTQIAPVYFQFLIEKGGFE